MIKALFTLFDANPALYWTLALAATLWCLVLAARPTTLAPEARGSTPWFEWALIGCLFAWRWPVLFAAHTLNPDEAQQIAGAITLTHDPVFWRSVDGSTAGPLNFYVLTLPALVGAPLDFFFARLLGLLMIAGSLVILHRTLAGEVGAAVAAPATLAAMLAFALTTDWDFLHLSSEHLSVLMSTAAAALWWRARPGAGGHSLGRWAAAGFVAGMLPWAKLQAAPFAALFGGAAVLVAAVRSKATPRGAWLEFGAYAGGFALPSALALILIFVAGVQSDFWFSYITRNVQYADQGWDLSFVLSEMVRLTTPLWTYPTFVVGCAVLAVTGMTGSLLRRQRPASFAIAAAVFALTAIVVVFSPRRGFPHYLLFSIVPLAALAGAASPGILSWPHRAAARRALLVALVLGSVSLVGGRLAQPTSFMIGQLAEHWRHPFSPLALKVRGAAQPGDSIAVWGWMTEIYVQCALPQAVRDAHSQRQIESGPTQRYYRERYLADFLQHRPAFFIDAVGDGAFGFQDRGVYAHETFPALARIIRADYVLVSDETHARLYVRRDRVGMNLQKS